jgi:hypothetical protein
MYSFNIQMVVIGLLYVLIHIQLFTIPAGILLHYYLSFGFTEFFALHAFLLLTKVKAIDIFFLRLIDIDGFFSRVQPSLRWA